MFKKLRNNFEKFLKEFRDFALKGNVIDMAIGIVIGGSFKQIVSSLVNDIIMPIVAFLTSDVDYSHAKIVLQTKTDTQAEIAINYGNFITTIIDFLIIALSIFIVIKWINRLQKIALEKALQKQQAQENASKKKKAKTDPQIKLLKEIKQLLKENLDQSKLKR